MKKIILIAVLTTVVCSSCEDFLNTVPIDKVAAVNYFTNEEGLTQGLAAVYDPLSTTSLYRNYLWLHLEGSTDEGYYARSNAPVVATYSHNASDPTVAGLWATLYDGANRANNLIANIDLPKVDEDKRQVILGEALFLRGYYYFMLVTRFGDVPMKLTPTTSPVGVQLPRTPSAEIYAQVLKDMTAAEGMVNTSSSMGYASRVSKTVVQGILSRVCLHMAGYPLNDVAKYKEALAWSKKVVASGEHALNVSFNPDPALDVFNPSFGGISNNAYRQIFINATRDIYDVKESMWEAEFSGNLTDAYREEGNVGQNNGIQFGNTDLPIGYSYAFQKGTARLFNSYGKGDLRRDWVLTTYTYNSTTGAKLPIAITPANASTRDNGKWRREYQTVFPKSKFGTSINFPILRYADVLLMEAEAENQVNGPTALAYDAVNQVRRRGYGLPVNAPSVLADLPAGLSKANFQLAIEDERMRELCFEGVRKSDLIRWNKFASTMASVGAEMAKAPTPTGNQYGKLAGLNVGAAGPDGNNKFLLFPIPTNEIGSNKLITENNPGW